jgi:phosphoribosylformylglycinamidine cyclo-ligase
LVVTYAQAGVNIDEGDRLVDRIRKSARSTFDGSVLGDIGAFGAFYDAGFRKYKSPVLVSSVDGVGTKLLVAQIMGKHDSVGHDLVNHCVNDILACGAQPLFFLDYFATGKLKNDVAEQIISGFVKACRENRCSLIGGETAEMPGLYGDNEYDLAGMIVGLVEKKRIINGEKIRKGDVLIGLPSTGLHTNGYSLARKVLFVKHTINDYVKELGCTLGEALLAIHRSYLSTVRPVLKRFAVHGLSHITGGGIVGNTMRIVPEGLGLNVDWTSWRRPAIFQLIQQTGEVPEKDMQRTFNLGIGFIMIVPKEESKDILRFLRKKGEAAIVMGEVIKQPKYPLD